jgi:HK97 family phage portal protein
VGLLERINEARQPRNAWPVGTGSLTGGEQRYGHDDERFSPEEYGDYLATSNDIYTAASLRARLMSSLDLNLYDREGPDKKLITSGPEYDLLRYVNPYWTRRRLARMDELCMCIWGETFWALESGPSGPTEIWWMKPSRVKPVPHESGYLAGFLYYPVMGGEPLAFRPDEIVWHRYPNPLDEFSALSPLAAARLAADTGNAMMRSNRDMFKNGLSLAGLVVPATDKVSFSEDQAKDLERQLKSRFTGTANQHRWAVLRYEAQFKPLTVTQKDAEWSEGLNISLRGVANAYGIPLPMMNEMAGATLANASEYEKVLWVHTLVPDSQLRADEIVEQFLPRFRTRTRHAEYDYTRIAALQESETEQWSREVEAIRVGGITINEWRRKHGLPDVPWGDVWWAPVNQDPVADGESAHQADPKPATVKPAARMPKPDPAAEILRLFDRPLTAVNGTH